MKLLFILLCIMILSCEKSVNTTTDDLNKLEMVNTVNYTKENILIAYFTWADNTILEDSSKINPDAETSASLLPPGNAGLIANWIYEEVGGDLFSIITENKYPSDYNKCINQARKERDNNDRPKLTQKVNNIDNYDIIFLGFPNWWYTLPMAVFTFIESYDLSKKIIIPFCTHGTGGLSRTIVDLKKSLPNDCIILEPIGILRENVKNSKNEVLNWVRNLQY